MFASKPSNFSERLRKKPDPKPDFKIIEAENDFPFAAGSITDIRVGSVHAVATAPQEAALHELMRKLVDLVNHRNTDMPKSNIKIVYK